MSPDLKFGKEKLGVFPKSIVFDRSDCLAIFEPHGLDQHVLETQRIISSKTVQVLAQSPHKSVNFVFEQGRSISNNRARKLAKYTNTTEGMRTFFDYLFDEALSGKSQEAYTLFLVRQYFELHERFPSRITNTIEKPPHGCTPKVVYEFYANFRKFPTDTLAFNACAKMVSGIVMRDIRLAGQIANCLGRKGDPFIILVRGTGHIGIMQVLRRFYPDLVNGINFNGVLGVNVRTETSSFLNILWSTRFWDDILEPDGFNSVNSNYDAVFRKNTRRINSVFFRDPWKDLLLESIQKARKTESTHVDLILSQEIEKVNTTEV